MQKVRYLYSDIARFRKYLALYENIITLQIFVNEELKLPIVLFVTTLSGSLYCHIYQKNLVFKSSFFTVEDYVTFCSCFHFFQIDREMSTIKLMTVSLV